MEEQVNEKVISITIQSAEKVGRVLTTAISKYCQVVMAEIKEKGAEKKANGPQKMKIKDLVGTGEGINKLKLHNMNDSCNDYTPVYRIICRKAIQW